MLYVMCIYIWLFFFQRSGGSVIVVFFIQGNRVIWAILFLESYYLTLSIDGVKFVGYFQ